MSHEKGLHPGAVWKKTDFQIHTPRDPQWGGGPNLAGGTDELEAARQLWADDFVDECIAREISAISITDHHDFCFVPYVKTSIENKGFQDKLWLFPGVEITCDVSVQCLILFDKDSQEDDWRRLFGGALASIAWPDKNAETNPQANLCGQDVEPIIKLVNEDQQLSGKSIILPHGRQGGHKTMIRQGMQARFRKLPFDGVYGDQGIASFEEVTKRKIRGEIPEWGTRRRGIIPTGDNRHQNFENLGTNTCWVRLGEPTTESIRQALLADKARICYDKPIVPAHRITKLEVSSTLTGPDFVVSINDGFTALIGGRGAGKSALLEYLRFGIGRSAYDTEEVSRERARDQKLIEDTIGTGQVRVTLERNGIIEIWTRTGDDTSTITVNADGAGPELLSIEEAQRRFKARAFYQKQLSSLVSSSADTAEQITGIAAAESLDRRKQIAKEISSQKRATKDTFRDVVEFWIAEEALRQAVGQVADINRRLSALRFKLADSGLEQEKQDILNIAPAYKNVELLLEQSNEEISDAKNVVSEIKSSAVLPSFESLWQYSEVFTEIKIIQSLHSDVKTEISGKVGEIVGLLDKLKGESEKFVEEFSKKKGGFDSQHESALKQQESVRDLVGEIEKLSESLQRAEIEENKAKIKLEGLKDAQSKLKENLEKLNKMEGQAQTLLQDAADKVEAMSGGSLRAIVQKENTPIAYVSVLMTIFESCRIRDLQARCEERAVEGKNEQDAAKSWQSVVEDLSNIFKIKSENPLSENIPDTQVHTLLQGRLLGDLTEQQRETAYKNLTEDLVADAVAATPSIFIAFEYRDRNEFIPFERASPGQQASALLQLLLNQEAGTLIIDQPEDDLDNRVIMEVVGKLHEAKRHRQIIFSTHNPNFVVNGDADKVVALQPTHTDLDEEQECPRVAIDTDGAIETETVRKAITETMEGGEKAFELRGRKYSFEKLQ